MGFTQRDIEIRMKRREDAIEQFKKELPELEASLKEIDEQFESFRVKQEKMLSNRRNALSEFKKNTRSLAKLQQRYKKLKEQEAYNKKYELYVEKCIEYLDDVNIGDMTIGEIIAKAQEKHFHHLLDENNIMLDDDDEYEGYYVIGDVFDCLERTDDDDDFGCCHKRFGYTIESEVVENISEYGDDFSIDSKIDNIYGWNRIC
jgi:DNA repair exonuclease SbcCD ATPase subunit